MIEAYAFLAMFTVQILSMSVLHPAWFSKFVRVKAKDVPAERFAQLYPGVDFKLSTERFLFRYRAANTVIAVLGFLLLGWLYTNVELLDWDSMASFYFILQVVPLGFLALRGFRYRKVLRPALLDTKRKAVLRRRGLFDFVSPFTVFLAAAGYFLFAALVIYIQRNPFPGFAGYINIVMVTLIYALNGFGVYLTLYGKMFNPIETYAARMHTTGLTVKACVYGCIVCVVFLSLNFTLILLALRSWKPFATSAFFVISALICSMGFIAPPRQPEAEGLGPREATEP